MLRITIPATEQWDESKNEFVYAKPQTLSLEHSLVSISKWEAKWRKSFLSKTEKTVEETVDYVRCMTLTQNVDPSVYYRLTDKNIAQINEYIEMPMTAIQKFADDDQGGTNREPITSELIYYWMICLSIPFECQKWHLNRLLALIRVCNIKNKPRKKMSKKALMSRNAALNASRRRKLGTKG